MAIVSYRRAGDPRMRSTFAKLTAALGQGALLRRYDDRYSPATRKEAAFGACSFWAVEYLARLGETEEASRRFEQLLGWANDLGLFAEEIDGESGQARGNFPQAFTHAGLINAAQSLVQADVREE